MIYHQRWFFIFIGALLFGLLFLTAYPSTAAERGPIKVGLLLPYTGIMPLVAKEIQDGAELYFDEIGRKAGGRPIEIIKEDTELTPTVGLTKVRRLVEQHKVQFVIGPVSSAVGLAIHDYLRQQKVIQINPTALSRELTSPQKAAQNIFRVCDTTDQSGYPMGKWIYKNTPYRNMVLTGTDFATGHHTLEAFKAAFEGSGGKIIKEVYPKMSTMDFAPFLAAIDVKGVDAVFGFYGGTDAVQFVKQYEEFGLKKRLPLYGHIVMADDPYLPSMGDAAIGLITVGPYTCMIDSPKNKAFVKAYNTKYGENPSRVSEFGYTAAQVIGAAAEALRGQVEDVPVVASEIMKIAPKIETPSGPLGFDQYHQRVMNMYVLKTEKRNGQLVNAVLDKLGRVPQADVWGWWNK